jgi:hypothetical protein
MPVTHIGLVPKAEWGRRFLPAEPFTRSQRESLLLHPCNPQSMGMSAGLQALLISERHSKWRHRMLHIAK